MWVHYKIEEIKSIKNFNSSSGSGIFGILVFFHGWKILKRLLGCSCTMLSITHLTLKLPVTKIAEFANSIAHDKVAHDEPPHLDLLCLPSKSLNSHYDVVWT